MAGNQSVESRVKKLDEIENNVAVALKAVASALDEISKDKPNEKVADRESNRFLQTLDKIENEMTSQINHLIYVAAGASSDVYGSTNYMDMIEHNEIAQMASQVSARLGKVGDICEKVNKEKNSSKDEEDRFKEEVIENNNNKPDDLTME